MILQKQQEALELGFHAIRASGGTQALKGQPTPIATARALPINWETYPFRYHFGVKVESTQTGEPPDPGTVTEQQVRDGGEAWGRLMAENDAVPGVVPVHIGEVTTGFSIQNEFDYIVAAVYNETLQQGGTSQQALEAAEEEAEAWADIIIWFAEGVHDGYRETTGHEWGGVCLPGGMAEPTSAFARIALQALVEKGAFAAGPGGEPPLLDGADVHLYRAEDGFDIDPEPTAPGPYEVTIVNATTGNPVSLVAQARKLVEDVGLDP